jgi:tetratricopeptide (TPR) repeat protein
VVWEAWNRVDAIADRWYAWIDKFGKLTGFFVTLGSGAYAIYQKLYFAEFNMHVRLREFQHRVESRLRDSNKKIGEAARRPSPAREFETPIFTDQTVNPVLRRMKWGRRPKADESLQATLDQLEKQIPLWDNQKKEYELRKAQACLLKGAIAAARAAKKMGEEARKDNLEALGFFEEAFTLSNKTDVDALEYVAHQQVRLGEYQTALETFGELAASIATDAPSLRRARVLKFQAEVWECRKPQPNLQKANSLLIDAAKALPGNAPLLEKAEIHEMHGRVREKAAINKATQSYTEAERFYHRIVDGSNSDDDDVAVAKAGLQRVRDALQRIRLQPLTYSDNGQAPAPPPDSHQDGT